MEVLSFLSDSREAIPVGAVVIHQHRERHLAVYHPVDASSDDCPQLMPGRLMTHDALRELSGQLLGGIGRVLLPANVLCADLSLLAWYRRPLRRPIIFQTKDPRLNLLSGHTALHPALLFVARPGRLSVFALTSQRERPAADTQVWRAPYYNLYASGAMCEGNVPMPATLTPTQETLDGFETAFYDSAFVHTNLGSQQLVRFPGGHVAFWERMGDVVNDEMNPDPYLVPLSQGGKSLTVADVIAGDKPLLVDSSAPEETREA